MKSCHWKTWGWGLLLLPVSAAMAQSYPVKPIRMIVAFPAGNGVDISTRNIASRVQPLLGQPVTVENRPGASGIIGTEAAAKAAPDGYTLYSGPITTIALVPYLYAKLPFDVEKDFVAITQASLARGALMIHSGLQVNDLRELIEMGKKRPLNVGTVGVGSNYHLFAAWFSMLTGVQLNYIHYNTTGPAQDLVGGRLDFVVDGFSVNGANLRAGKVKALAQAGKSRQSMYPDVPTFAEAGLPEFEPYSWTGFFAPAATPAPIVNQLGDVFARVIKSPEVAEQYRVGGTDAVGNTPAEFAAFVKSEQTKWSRLIRAAGVRLEQ
jgi:tripartite-type tricarboxylate transporter receptor subunit TctC